MIDTAGHSSSLQRAYLRACELDVTAFKPGNVSVFRPGHGMAADDFLASARITAPILASTSHGVGERIYHAITATRGTVGCNTNLGIVLLAAPMFAAMQSGPDGSSLHRRLRSTLHALSVNDAHWAYRAIRVASPAGLGRADEHDVAAGPEVDLRRAMLAAAERDRIAYQYGHGYQDILDFCLPLLRSLQHRWQDDAWACVGVYMALLARFPDSHVARKHGIAKAEAVQRQARDVSVDLLARDEPRRALRALSAWDEYMKRNRINPGTTADMTVATIMAKDFDALASQRVIQPAKQNCSGSESLRCVST